MNSFDYKNSVIFLDKDGLLIQEVCNYGEPKRSARNLNEVNIFEDAIPTLALLKEKFALVLITNQPDINKQVHLEEEEININLYLMELFNLDAAYWCPHSKNQSCECRKPKTKMFDHFFNDYKYFPEKKFMVGDRVSDVVAAESIEATGIHFINKNVNCQTCSGKHVKSLREILKIVLS